MEHLKEVPSMDGLELSSLVSTTEPYFMGDESTAQYRIAVMDYGVKKHFVEFNPTGMFL